MIIYTPPKNMERIPVIDVSGATPQSMAGRRQAALEIHKACRDSGFFYIVGHGIPVERLEEQIDCARRFFALPQEVKMSIDIAKSTNMRGYEPFGVQTLDEGSPPDAKESLMTGRPTTLTGRALNRYEGANQWPEGEPWLARTVLDYNDRMLAVGRLVTRLLALSLELDEDYFEDAMSDPSISVRLLRYPALLAAPANNQLGCGAHTDWGFMTLLLQDDIGGLEVRNREGDWVRAAPVRGSLLVNLGDAMPILTGGLYQSNMHRVLNNTAGRDRYSVVTFLEPHPTYLVDCVPSCRPDDGSFVPAPRSMADHIQAMFERSYGTAS